jgi:hypothetical protein
MTKSIARFAFTILIIVTGATRALGQTPIPETLINGTIREQMTWLEEKTRIYENYRAIREDMFQVIKKNAVDSLGKAHNQLKMLAAMNKNLNIQIDSLTSNLTKTDTRLQDAVKTKNNIKVIGIEINKVAYNSVMWIIILSLLLLLGIGFIFFRRNVVVTSNTKKELNSLRSEYEDYRQKTRLEREKMSMDHFKEVQRLKGR